MFRQGILMLGFIGRTAGRIGIGLVAGAAGTATMTLVQKIEMKMTGREPSTAPADAVDEIADVAPEDEEKRERFSNLVHWGYGTSLGAVRGILASTGLSPLAADAAFLGAVWGAEMIFLPALDVSPPPTEWGAEAIAKDFGHHLVYASAVALAWRLLTSDRPID